MSSSSGSGGTGIDPDFEIVDLPVELLELTGRTGFGAGPFPVEAAAPLQAVQIPRASRTSPHLLQSGTGCEESSMSEERPGFAGVTGFGIGFGPSDEGEDDFSLPGPSEEIFDGAAPETGVTGLARLIGASLALVVARAVGVAFTAGVDFTAASAASSASSAPSLSALTIMFSGRTISVWATWPVLRTFAST